MPPRIKITKEEIVSTAFESVRKNGVQALNARSLATALNCSTQPVFSNFTTMNELREAVIAKAEEKYREYTESEIKSGIYPQYKAMGMAYIRFAKEEKELFKLLYMRDRTEEVIPKETEFGKQVVHTVHTATGLEGDSTELFHLEMWAFVHGIATMLATDYLNFEMDFISKIVTDAYRGLRMQYGIGGS